MSYQCMVSADYFLVGMRCGYCNHRIKKGKMSLVGKNFYNDDIRVPVHTVCITLYQERHYGQTHHPSPD